MKSYDTEWAVALGLQYLKKPDGVIVRLPERHQRRAGGLGGRPERCLGCVITIGAGMY